MQLIRRGRLPWLEILSRKRQTDGDRTRAWAGVFSALAAASTVTSLGEAKELETHFNGRRLQQLPAEVRGFVSLAQVTKWIKLLLRLSFIQYIPLAICTN